MEIDTSIATLWNILLTLVVIPFGWAFNKLFQEVKAQQILLRETREQYARRNDVKEDMDRIVQSLVRLEDKIDRMLTKEG